MFSVRFCRWAIVGSLIAVPAAWADDATTSDEQAAPPAAKAPAGKTTVQDGVAALVNGKPIRESLVQTILQRQVPPAQQAAVRPRVLGLLISAKLVEGFLDRQDVKVPPELVENQIRKVKRDIEDQAKRAEESPGQPNEGQVKSWADFLKKNRLTEDSIREQLAQSLQLRWEAYLKESGSVSDAKIKAFYEENKKDLYGDEVRASHILIKVPPQASPETRVAAREKLQAIKDQVESGKLDFSDAVKKYSEDPGKNQGEEGPGDVGFFHRKGMMVEPFAKAAFELKKGQLSEIVQSPFGVHLIKVTDRKPAEDVPIEKVKGEIREMISNQLQGKIVEQEQKTAKIQITGARPRPKG